jgi:hypothetical protein
MTHLAYHFTLCDSLERGLLLWFLGLEYIQETGTDDQSP